MIDCRVQESVDTRTSAVLEDIITQDQMQHLGTIFRAARRGLTIGNFRKALRVTMGDVMTDEELDMIFMKVRERVVE